MIFPKAEPFTSWYIMEILIKIMHTKDEANKVITLVFGNVACK